MAKKKLTLVPKPLPTDCTVEHFLEAAFEADWEASGERADEIFGPVDKRLPEDELNLIFSTAFLDLSQEDKLKALRDHRAKTISGRGGWN